MDFHVLVSNLRNPTILFFILGFVAVRVKSDLEIPASSSRFISLYLLFSIGFKGGQELSHSGFSREILYALLFGLALSVIIPAYTFFLLKRKLSISDAGAIASSYGSVSAVTFVAAMSFLEMQKMTAGGHMVAVMAFMEAPAIVVGVMLMMKFDKESRAGRPSITAIAQHALTNGSVLMILGSLLIGMIADTRQAEGIKPFTTDIFKGFLAIFLLEMGMVTARRISAFRTYGRFVSVFALVVPALNGCLAAYFSQFFTAEPGSRFIFAILAASASYIAVPAAMRIAAPRADPGLYIPMALGLTFPFNITLGMPLYCYIVNSSG